MADIFKIPDIGAFTIECVHSAQRATPQRFDSFDQAKQYADDAIVGNIFIVCRGLKKNNGDIGFTTSYHIDAQRIQGVWKMANE